MQLMTGDHHPITAYPEPDQTSHPEGHHVGRAQAGCGPAQRHSQCVLSRAGPWLAEHVDLRAQLATTSMDMPQLRDLTLELQRRILACGRTSPVPQVLAASVHPWTALMEAPPACISHAKL